jgi:hypothetical protein
MKNDTKKTGNGHQNATAQLAEINAEIEALNQKRIGLAEPLKARHVELTGELLALEIEVKELDPTWKPASLRPKPIRNPGIFEPRYLGCPVASHPCPVILQLKPSGPPTMDGSGQMKVVTDFARSRWPVRGRAHLPAM